MPLLTISIVTWNSEREILNCLESILSQSYADYEVIVVDNASMDTTRERVRTIHDRRIRLLELSLNVGYCGGHNHAIKEARGDFILLVNPDIRMNPGYIENALRRMMRDDEIGTVSGLLIQNELTQPDCRIDSAGLDILPDRRCRLRHHSELLSEVTLSFEEIFGADGALPLYRRAMIEDVAIGGFFFDVRFFAHKEDWDVSWRARLLGWKAVFEPACIAIHPRFFKPENLKLRKQVTANIKCSAVKNQLLLLLKNEDLDNFIRDFFPIVSRQMAILVFVILFEQSSLKAYIYVLRHWKEIMADRALVQEKRRVTSAMLRKWFISKGDYGKVTDD